MAYTTINKSSLHMNNKLYTGNGSTQSVTGIGFQPDFVWIKNRTTDFGHRLLDSVRGATKELFSNSDSVENTNVDSLTSFDSDGFSLGSHGGVNENSSNFVSWNWLANGAGSANTDGTITSTVSANTTSGFSIVSYTGNDVDNTKVGHGLGVAPSVMIFKSRSLAGRSWSTYHKSVPITQIMFLNTDSAATTTSSRFNDIAPTSSLINLGTNGDVNDSGITYIAYCFAEKQGFSKFGSYTGNGNADGTFVYTGFKPAFVMIKETSVAGESWYILDIKRNTFNPCGKRLRPNSSGVEEDQTNNYTDILSNGFKLRTTDGRLNRSGSTYIYMAFAEAPLVGTNNVPCTAR